MNRGKWISVALIVIALLAIGGVSFSLIQTSAKLNQTRSDLSSQYAIATNVASTQAREYDKATEEVSALKAQATEAVSTLKTNYNLLDQTRISMDVTSVGLGKSNIELILQVAGLKKEIECPSYLSVVDFTNNSTISKALIVYVGDRDGSNIFATWEIVWNNSRAAIHRLTGKYLWVYVVTFASDKLGMKDAIYDVGGNCFIYIKQ